MRTGGKRRLSDRKRTFQYVPLLDGLQLLLNNREVFDEVLDLKFNFALLKCNAIIYGCALNRNLTWSC